MRIKILSLFAAALLVSACATEPEENSAVTGKVSSTQDSTSKAPSGSGTTKVKAKKAPPSGAPAGSRVEFFTKVGDRVFFDFNKSEIGPKAAEVLQRQAAWLQKHPNKTLVVEGHCDERGTREYNLALGERRANAVREYLISLDISPARIETISYGKERPAVLGSNESAWAQNRRSVSLPNDGAGS